MYDDVTMRVSFVARICTALRVSSARARRVFVVLACLRLAFARRRSAAAHCCVFSADAAPP